MSTYNVDLTLREIREWFENILPKIPSNIPFPVEAKTLTLLIQGATFVKFDRQFERPPVVVGVYHNFKARLPSLTIKPVDIQLARITLPRMSLRTLSNISLPQLPEFKSPIDKVEPWGVIWEREWLKVFPDYPVLDLIGNAIGAVLRFVGNQFFFIYYSGTGDFGQIAKAVATPIIDTMIKHINNYINNTVNATIADIQSRITSTISASETNINIQIAHTQAVINNTIDRFEKLIEDSVNTSINNLLATYGSVKDNLERYSVPMPFNPISVSNTGFAINNPQPGTTISYIAIGV